jgi:hypothetical protein
MKVKVDPTGVASTMAMGGTLTRMTVTWSQLGSTLQWFAFASGSLNEY